MCQAQWRDLDGSGDVEEIIPGLVSYGKSPSLIGKPWENHGKMVIDMDNQHL
jgi:hypothetical protein